MAQCHLHLIKSQKKLSYLKQSESIEKQSEAEWGASWGNRPGNLMQVKSVHQWSIPTDREFHPAGIKCKPFPSSKHHLLECCIAFNTFYAATLSDTTSTWCLHRRLVLPSLLIVLFPSGWEQWVKQNHHHRNQRSHFQSRIQRTHFPQKKERRPRKKHPVKNNF